MFAHSKETHQYLSDAIGLGYVCRLPADDDSFDAEQYRLQQLEDEKEEKRIHMITGIIVYGSASVVGIIGTGLLIMSIFKFRKSTKDTKVSTKQNKQKIPVSNAPAFDPGGLYTTTTPLSGSGYGASEEVSVTSPLNNDFYFEVVEELKFFGSDEIIQ